MKSRISSRFDELKRNGQRALITYITAGDPSLAVTEKLVRELEGAGADIIELGVPFSDPLADGPTIQASHIRALKKDVSAGDVIKLVAKIRKTSSIPLVLMLSYNLIVRYGVEKFIDDCIKAGVDGIIPPDLSYEEAPLISKKAKDIDVIFLVSPTSSDERIKAISKLSTGFIYLVSLTGITGERKSLPSDVEGNVLRIRKFTDKPVAVGFGISKPGQVKDICKVSDGVIVGSAIVKIIEQNIGKKDMPNMVGAFARRLKLAAK